MAMLLAAAPAPDKIFTQADLDAAVSAAKAPFTDIDVDEHEKLKAE